MTAPSLLELLIDFWRVGLLANLPSSMNMLSVKTKHQVFHRSMGYGYRAKFKAFNIARVIQDCYST